MKVLLVSNVFPPGFIGGYELGALDVAIALRERGHSVIVMTSDYFLDDDAELADLNVERSLECTIFGHERVTGNWAQLEGVIINWRNIRRLSSGLRRHKPDLVLLFNTAGLGPVGIYQYLAALEVPTLSYFMDNVFDGIRLHQERWATYQRIFGPFDVKMVGEVITMSKNLGREMGALLPGIESGATCVPGWVSSSLLSRQRATSSVLRRSRQSTSFVFCSRVAAHKGVFLMVDAAAELKRRGFSNFSIDIYGAGQVTPVLQRIATLGLSGLLNFKGQLPKDEMVSTFSEYDALLFPTWEREPFGFVVSEAATAGCVPIMTSGIGAAEWFIDGEDCIKIERTVDDLTRAMLAIITMSGDEIQSMGKRCARNATNNLNFERWMNLIEAKCLDVSKAPKANYSHSKPMEAAFLALNDLWRGG